MDALEHNGVCSVREGGFVRHFYVFAVKDLSFGYFLGLSDSSGMEDEFWRDEPLLVRIAALLGLLIGGAGVYFCVLWAGGVRLSDFRNDDLNPPD